MQSDQLQRRELITLLGGTAVAWPFAARAQQRSKMARLGVLLFSTPQGDPQMKAVHIRLRELGYVEGQNLIVIYRYADGKYERLPDLAAELIAEKPDVVLALGGDVAPYAAKATSTTPIVFISSADPVQLGLAASLARPSRNATGVTLLLDDTASKRLELLKEVVPRVQRTAFLWNPEHPDNELPEAQRAAPALDIQLQPVEMRGSGNVESALRAVGDARPDALYVVSSRHTVLNIPAIIDFANANRLPLAGGWGAWARAGGLISFGPNTDEMARRAIDYVDKILKGAKPADLPIQQPTKFELVINAKAAKAIGIEVPPILLARADEVIE
jgi:putative tryptophan/tyrosine transport system substrate-binding protein